MQHIDPLNTILDFQYFASGSTFCPHNVSFCIRNLLNLNVPLTYTMSFYVKCESGLLSDIPSETVSFNKYKLNTTSLEIVLF